MYCPTCRSEYEPGVTRCAECEAALVENLPEDARADAEEFVPLREVNDPDELAVLQSVLDAAGVPYMLQGEEAQGLFPFPGAGANLLPPSLGAIIHVPRSRLDEARELIETTAVPTDPEPDPDAESTDPQAN
jgi:hypothetical protein